MSNVISPRSTVFFFFFNDTATTEIYTLSLHDALPIFARACRGTDLADRPTHLVRVVACALGARLGRCELGVGGRLLREAARVGVLVVVDRLLRRLELLAREAHLERRVLCSLLLLGL